MARTLDQMLASEKPEVVAKAQKAATEMLLNIHLAELRERMNLTQGTLQRHWASGNRLSQRWRNRGAT